MEGGKAVLQWYDAGPEHAASDAFDSEEEEEVKPPKKKRKKEKKATPMILALCTPIMNRAHEYVQQSRGVVFIDVTYMFDVRIAQFLQGWTFVIVV